MQTTVSRPRKLSHLDTIFYEMDMLDYCLLRLRGGKWSDERDYYLCIEGFLLHFRNLIQFFGNEHDLKAGKPAVWSPRKLTEAEVTSIQDDRPYQRHNGQISQYLSHCTKSRVRGRDWPYLKMHDEIQPLLKSMRRLFPSTQRSQGETAWLSSESASTATVSVLHGWNETLQPGASGRKTK